MLWQLFKLYLVVLKVNTTLYNLTENSSLVAESERDQSRLPKSLSASRNRIRHSRVQIPKGNFYITSPFKQGPEKDVKGPVLVRFWSEVDFTCNW